MQVKIKMKDQIKFLLNNCAYPKELVRHFLIESEQYSQHYIANCFSGKDFAKLEGNMAELSNELKNEFDKLEEEFLDWYALKEYLNADLQSGKARFNERETYQVTNFDKQCQQQQEKMSLFQKGNVSVSNKQKSVSTIKKQRNTLQPFSNKKSKTPKINQSPKKSYGQRSNGENAQIQKQGEGIKSKEEADLMKEMAQLIQNAKRCQRKNFSNERSSGKEKIGQELVLKNQDRANSDGAVKKFNQQFVMTTSQSNNNNSSQINQGMQCITFLQCSSQKCQSQRDSNQNEFKTPLKKNPEAVQNQQRKRDLKIEMKNSAKELRLMAEKISKQYLEFVEAVKKLDKMFADSN